MSRPTKLTHEVSTRIVLALKAGNYLSVAAAAAGISQATLHRWLRDKRPVYRAFREAVGQAIAESEVLLVGLVYRAAPQNQSAAVKLLERHHPKRWGRARADSAHPAPDESIHKALGDDDPVVPEGIPDRGIRLSPEWAHPIYKLMAAAARGRTPAEFFEGPDRLAGLRKDGSPSPPWWKEVGEPVDLVASAPSDDTDIAAGEDPRPSTEATPPIDD